MKIIEVLAVAIRILGVLLLIRMLESLPYWLQALAIISPDRPVPESDTYITYIQYAIFTAMALIAFLMLKFPTLLARSLVGNLRSDSTLLEEKGQAIQIAGIAIIGIYILTWTIPDLFHNALIFWAISNHLEISGNSWEIKINIAITLIEIGIGFYCALGAQGISTIISKLRS